MHKINGNKLGLALGGFLGFFHLVWSVLVYLGWAEPLMNFIYQLHFMSSSAPMLDEFNALNALELIVVTSVIGYAIGNVFAFFWNWAFKAKQ